MSRDFIYSPTPEEAAHVAACAEKAVLALSTLSLPQKCLALKVLIRAFETTYDVSFDDCTLEVL